MEQKISNKNLNGANKAKKDEFYTQLTDIEKELKHYKEHFKDKTVFLNCDDPEESNFWKYFALNFKVLGLKKLIATHFDAKKPTYKLEKNNGNTIKIPLKQNGDFRSQESIEILKEADIVVTNPPFSLLREYIHQLMEYNKKFVIIGNINSLSYKEIFKLVKENKIWLGHSIHSGDREFKVPDDYPLNAAGHRIDENGIKYIRIKGVRWLTNLDYKERHEDFLLYKIYKGHEDEYPKYDDYDAINVDVTKDIPRDYKECIGVPITFIDKYNPDQFEIVGQMASTKIDEFNHGYPYVDGKKKYARILIKNKKV